MSTADTRTAVTAGGGTPDDGLGPWLRERRLARGWSKAEFARRLHAAMSFPGRTGAERGEHHPQRRRLGT